MHKKLIKKGIEILIKRIMDNYYRLKREMEIMGVTYGLSDPRTIIVSNELDLIVNELIKFQNSKTKKVEITN